jgi:signal transduction histidine kinase
MRAQFEAYEFGPRKRSIRTVMVLAAAFMWLGSGIDVMVYPHLAERFFFCRLIAATLLLVGWFVSASVKQQWLLRLVAHIWVLVPLVAFEWMIYEARDPASSYYGGVNLLIVGVALLMRWRVRDSLLHAMICVSSFVALMYFLGLTYRGGVIPSYFVLVTGVIAVMATYFYDAGRFREFCLLREIQDANRQLRAADETKARFFANISHELRTPLTLILGPLENLRMHKKYKKDRLIIEHVDMIEDNAMRLLRLINDILDLVKLDSEESPPSPEVIDVEDFINRLSKNLKPIAELKNITLSCRCDTVDQDAVWLDRDRLEKIVLNLAVNAVKFTSSGGIITLGAETKEGSLTLSVGDTGEGMDEEALANIFVRFWQADMSAKRKHRGAGIGLALVKSLTESMNGKISVESELGKGAEFTVVLPAPKPDEAITEEPQKLDFDVLEQFNEQAKYRGLITTSGDRQSSPESDRYVVTSGGRKRILVAEDEDSMRAFVVRQLDQYDIIEARDGEEAYALALETKPDLMILDFMMPKLDGIELTARLRGDATTARIPIILVTAQAGETARLMALEAGVNDFLTKPFSSVELIARASNLLLGGEFEAQLAENNVYLEAAYGQLKDQEAILVQTEKLSSLGRMSAGIVHENNNPLNYTQTALYALKSFERQIDEEDREDYLEVLGDAREGVARVVGIVSGLRSFTRGDAVLMSDVVLSDVIESACKLSGDAMVAINYKSDVSPDLIIHGNEIQLCQLFVNMFQNAIRAIQVQDEKKKDSEIKVVASLTDDNRVIVKIRDSGCGISKEDIIRIFDPFFTKNDVGEGMGLGLSITYRIIDQHGATIEVDSEVGKFTEFTLYFPQKDKE